MTFRLRLALFLVAALVGVQALTAVLVYEVTRRHLIEEGERQLARATDSFAGQLDDAAARIAENVQILSLDFPLRAAIAQGDRETVRSALRNHGRRIGAARMMLVDLDGGIVADTDAAGGERFPFPDLLARARDARDSRLVALDGHAWWYVVVPVSAPERVGQIAAAIAVDDARLSRLQSLSSLPHTIELVARGEDGAWQVLAHGQSQAPVSEALLDRAGAVPAAARLVLAQKREYVALARSLAGEHDASHGVVAVLGYSLDDALRPYREVAVAWLALIALGTGVGLAGALLIARGVSRPIESLAESARRIEAGDYGATPLVRGTGEIAQLDAALASMRRAIGEREERIRFQAGHDAVTGLANRFAAEAAISRLLVEQAGQPAALVTIGLSRLPETVKTMGHAISDRLMQDVAARLRRMAGARLVARVSDGSFAILEPGVERSAAIAFAFRALDALAEPYREADIAIDLGPAIGIALHPQHGDTAPALMQRAEVALFLALGAADPVAVYDPATDPHRPERLALMSELREAIDADRLRLHYQPKLELATGRIDSVEALVRWPHERRGPIAPDAFIGLAEETGNVRRLTRWVLAAAIAQAKRWQSAGLSLRIAVNVSARDLDDAELPRRIGELLAAHGVAASNLVLEVTESAVMARPDAALPVLARLSDLGVEISIDDFGVGQASFAYLRRIPVGELKIDRTFVTRLGDGGSERMIARSIVELGHGLGYRVTAEGVEDASALDCLRELGCDHAQGYFIARPMPADELDAFLERHGRATTA